MRVGRSEVAWYPVMFSVAMVVDRPDGERIVRLTGRRARSGSRLARCPEARCCSWRRPSQVSQWRWRSGHGPRRGHDRAPCPCDALRSSRSSCRRGDRRGQRLSSGSAILAPLLIAASVAAGVGWRAGFVVLPFRRGPGHRRRRCPPAYRGSSACCSLPSTPCMTGPAFEPSFRRRWLDLVPVVRSRGLCFVLWSTDLHDHGRRARSRCRPRHRPRCSWWAWRVGRVGGGQFSGRLARPRPYSSPRWRFAAAGFGCSGPSTWPVVRPGPLVRGLGRSSGLALSDQPVAGRSGPARSPRRAERALPLGSSLAIGTAPFVIAFLADLRRGCSIAYLVGPGVAGSGRREWADRH